MYFLVRAARKNSKHVHVSANEESRLKLLIEQGFLIKLDTVSAWNWVEDDVHLWCLKNKNKEKQHAWEESKTGVICHYYIVWISLLEQIYTF